MGRIRIETVAQMAKHGYAVSIKCKCGNNAVMTAAQLTNARVSRLVDLDDRLRCKVCKRRPVDVSLTFG